MLIPPSAKPLSADPLTGRKTCDVMILVTRGRPADRNARRRPMGPAHRTERSGPNGAISKHLSHHPRRLRWSFDAACRARDLTRPKHNQHAGIRPEAPKPGVFCISPVTVWPTVAHQSRERRPRTDAATVDSDTRSRGRKPE